MYVYIFIFFYFFVINFLIILCLLYFILLNSAPREKFLEDINVRDNSRSESKMQEDISPEVLLIPNPKNFNNDEDQAIKIGLYKILVSSIFILLIYIRTYVFKCTMF
jgi:hypothetical protein